MALLNQKNDITTWVNDYSDILYNYALQRIKDADDAKDLVQETFLAAWRNIDNYNGDASVKTWLVAILKNKIIDQYRKNASKKEQALEINEGETIFFDGEDHWSKGFYPKDWKIDYEHNIESKEFYIILNACKKKLKKIQFQVFSMKYMDDLESDEICKLLNLSNANYWVLIHRAKVQLRACLEINWLN